MQSTLRHAFRCFAVFAIAIAPLKAFAHPLVFGDWDGGVRPQTLSQCTDRMDLIARVLPADDGIAQFNTLYETTTRNMVAGIAAGRFEDAAFMTEFTVHFADFYFEAISSYFAETGLTPHSWLELFDRRERGTEFKPVLFAIAGMDAHINRDLPVVLSELFANEPRFPSRDSVRFRDYLVVNQVLADTFEQLRDQLLDGPIWIKILGDRTALPWIRTLRTKAWLDGQELWRLRKHPLARRVYLEGLDSATRVEAGSTFLFQF